MDLKLDDIKLPISLNSRHDVNMVCQELRGIIDVAEQNNLRQTSSATLPEISGLLKELATENNVNLASTDESQKLLKLIELVRDKAVQIHVSFAAEPPVDIMKKLIVWFRSEINPKTIINVGLQPSIAAGVVVRTPNKLFDFSLRQHLISNQDKLKAALGK